MLVFNDFYIVQFIVLKIIQRCLDLHLLRLYSKTVVL